MPDFMVGFDDGSVAVIGPGRKNLFGTGPNSNQQFTSGFEPNSRIFQKIPFEVAVGEDIQKIAAGGTFGRSSLFVLTLRNKDGVVASQKVLKDTSCLYWFGSGSFSDYNLRDAPNFLEFLNDELIKDISIYQTNIVLVMASGQLRANQNAIDAYNLSELKLGQAITGSFKPVSFPREGDKDGHRIPVKTVLGEYHMFVITENKKAYMTGQNIKVSSEYFVPAVEAKNFLKRTGSGIMSAVGLGRSAWQTFGYSIKKETFKEIEQIFIAPDSATYVITPHGVLLSLVMGGSLNFGERVGFCAMAATANDILLVNKNNVLFGWGHNVRAQLGQKYARKTWSQEFKKKQMTKPPIDHQINLAPLLGVGNSIQSMYMNQNRTYILTAQGFIIAWGRFLSPQPMIMYFDGRSTSPVVESTRASSPTPSARGAANDEYEDVDLFESDSE